MSAEAGHLVLVGGGHAHLHIIAHAAAFHSRGWGVTLIAPEAFWYSGLATAVLGRRLPAWADRVDLAALCRACGVAHIAQPATHIDATNQIVTVADGRVVRYDRVSLNVGSRVAPIAGGEANPRRVPVKPLPALLTLGDALVAALGRGEDRHVAVIGGGPSGVEVAGNLAALARRRGAGQVRVTLLARGPRLLPTMPAGAARSARRALRKAGVVVRTGCGVARMAGHHLVLADGERLAVDHAVQATGLAPPELIAQSALPATSSGAVTVDTTLAVPDIPTIFAAGDCASVAGYTLPKVGVYGVRAAPVLLANLLASIDNAVLQAFKPQKRYLLILNLGDMTGLAVRGRLWWRSRFMLALKDRLDWPFVQRYRRLAGEGDGPPANAGTDSDAAA